MFKKFRGFSLSLAIISLISACSGNGAKSFTFKYASQYESDFDEKVFYDDSYFLNPSNEYNPQLATCSLSFAMASFASNDAGDSFEQKSQNIQNLFKATGFKDIYVNEDYKKVPTTDSIGIVLGSKELEDATLIYCGLRGQGYLAEWASNFTLGGSENGAYHVGFYTAANTLLSEINKYVHSNNITGNVKIWFSGYSRAGAVSNIAAGLLDKQIIEGDKKYVEDVNLKKEDIYAYTFEAPQGVLVNYNGKIVEPKKETYNNIFNIVNWDDVVPRVAPREFSDHTGFTRYGVDKYLSSSITDINYKDNISKVIEIYQDVPSHDGIGDYSLNNFVPQAQFSIKNTNEEKNLINWNLGLILEEFISILSVKGVETRDAFKDSIEDGIRIIFEKLYKNGNPKGSAIDMAITAVRHILSTTNVQVLIDDLLNDPDYFLKDAAPILSKALATQSIEFDVQTIISAFKGLFLAAFKSLSENLTIFYSLLNLDNAKTIMAGHYPELCLANVQALDKNYNYNPLNYDMSGEYYKISIPSYSDNLKVKHDGHEIVSFIDGTPNKTGSSISYGIMKKNLEIYLPASEKYEITLEKNVENISIKKRDVKRLCFVDVSLDKTEVGEGLEIKI